MACKSKHMAAQSWASYFNGLEFTIHSWLVVHQKPAGAICPATTFNCEVVGQPNLAGAFSVVVLGSFLVTACLTQRCNGDKSET